MKKTYKIENLDCASCAAKMESAIAKIDGVDSATISFVTQKLKIEADESRIEDIMKAAAKACRRVEPDCRLIIE
ncbi:MAG: cation transporter [Oscillospiraceae bacterium]|nr:cation transporter [Oscillospiraceae bacterium]